MWSPWAAGLPGELFPDADGRYLCLWNERMAPVPNETHKCSEELRHVTPQRMSVLVLSFFDFYVVHHTDVEEEGFVKVVDHAIKM